MDGTETLHNLHRHDKNGADTYRKVRDSIAMFEKYQIEYNILTVVNRQVAENVKEIYKEYKQNGWKYQTVYYLLRSIWGTEGTETLFAYTRNLWTVSH